jgi:hypothetical protein
MAHVDILSQHHFGFKGFMDKFGFSDYNRAEEYVEREYENILKNAGYDKAREFKRKKPYLY